MVVWLYQYYNFAFGYLY